jgi:hypothetical protein
VRRWIAGAVAGVTLMGAHAALAAPPLRITSFQVLRADGRTPAAQPLTRGVTYTYRLDYRIGGRTVVRVRRAGTFWSPYRDRLIEIRPRPQMADPGRHFASDVIRVPRTDSPGTYRLTYAVTARDSRGATTRRGQLPMRFR